MRAKGVSPATSLQWLCAVASLGLCLGGLAAAQEGKERIDLDAIGRIKVEAFQRSQAMQVLTHITDVFGPRLTGSPYRQPAADFIQKTLTDWGLARVRTEPFPFGRGWAAERFSAHVISGQPWMLTGYPKAWTPGTNGTVRAEAVLAVIEKDGDFEPLRGKLRGKFALIVPKRQLTPLFEPVAIRLLPADLTRWAEPTDPSVPLAFGRARRMAQAPFLEKLRTFLVNEGVACALDAADRGLIGTSMVLAGGSHDPKAPAVPCQVTLVTEHYNRLFRMLEAQVTPTIEMTVQNRFVDDGRAYNILADLPGTDKANELVILAAHWDSWHAGTGAQDDGAGTAIVMEAARILRKVGLPLRRSVRLLLFDGEEQGLLGSQAYVRTHVADPETMTLKSEHAKISVSLNIDNGGGLLRGFLLNGNEAIGPVAATWMDPFRNLGMGLIAQRLTGGGDHVPFDAVGIPAFPLMQDPLEYQRTSHTNQDVLDRILPADIMQNAAMLASFAYHAANREQLMPRKPLPKPEEARHRWWLF